MEISGSEVHAGQPDGFERLWTPHRMAYITGEKRPVSTAAPDCPFCQAPEQSDEKSLIVARGKHCYVILNLFPYNPGHLLVVPYRHVPLYTDIAGPELAEFSAQAQRAMQVLGSVSGAAGFNLGMNQGQIAGAGIAGHLHQHVVPRWLGDANFLPIVGQTKALPELLADTWARLSRAWKEEQ